MKTPKSLLIALCALLATACSKNPEEQGAVTAILNQIPLGYDANGVWTGANDAQAQVSYLNMIFSHSYVADWNSWNGFVASRSSDTADHSDGNWLDHQYSAITGGGLSGTGTPYLIAYWNSSELLDEATTVTPSCYVAYGNQGALFQPLSAFVTNSSYAFYAMATGTAWSKKFEAGDYLKLLAYGITADGTITGPAECFLANYEDEYSLPVSNWTYFNMESLGVVKMLFFRMESSDSGKWGMNTPAYFAIDRMAIMPQQP